MSQRRRPYSPRRSQQFNSRNSSGFNRNTLSRFNRRSPYVRFSAIAAALSLLLVLFLVVAVHMHWYIAWLIGWSIVTFFFYRFDKRRSKGTEERVPEMILHALALIGGFPGAWAGRAYYRHKTLHTSFFLTLVISTMLHLGIAFWIFRTM